MRNDAVLTLQYVSPGHNVHTVVVAPLASLVTTDWYPSLQKQLDARVAEALDVMFSGH